LQAGGPNRAMIAFPGTAVLASGANTSGPRWCDWYSRCSEHVLKMKLQRTYGEFDNNDWSATTFTLLVVMNQPSLMTVS